MKKKVKTKPLWIYSGGHGNVAGISDLCDTEHSIGMVTRVSIHIDAGEPDKLIITTKKPFYRWRNEKWQTNLGEKTFVLPIQSLRCILNVSEDLYKELKRYERGLDKVFKNK